MNLTPREKDKLLIAMAAIVGESSFWALIWTAARNTATRSDDVPEISRGFHSARLGWGRAR